MRYLIFVWLLCLSIVAPTTLASFSEWRNCTITKGIWPDAARWSVDETRPGLNRSSTTTTTTKVKTPLYIAGFLPITDEFNDQLVCTVLIAVEHVNEYQGLLDDYELRIAWAWTEVTLSFFKYLKQYSNIIIISIFRINLYTSHAFLFRPL